MTDRLRRLHAEVREQGYAAALITPGSDLRYLTGYDAKPLERLTCLVVPAEADPVLIAPELERQAAQAAGVDIPLKTWEETENPWAAVAQSLPVDPGQILVDDHMWAERLLTLQQRYPTSSFTPASTIIAPLRMRKTADELDALREAGAAIDRVHEQMGTWLRAGRTEREVARDIHAAILDAGHVQVDFIIVGSGPNGASPHHEVSDRVIGEGEPIVVDIGGTTPAGYCSDSTRNYVIGAPPEEFAREFERLLEAQERQVAAVRPGVTAESIDAVGRDYLAEHDLAEYFVHRTGHGIGQETHEEPYIVAGNELVLEPSMTFSVEPGIYREGRWGARIEDIVAVTADGVERFNNSPRDLVVLP